MFFFVSIYKTGRWFITFCYKINNKNFFSVDGFFDFIFNILFYFIFIYSIYFTHRINYDKIH